MRTPAALLALSLALASCQPTTGPLSPSPDASSVGSDPAPPDPEPARASVAPQPTAMAMASSNEPRPPARATADEPAKAEPAYDLAADLARLEAEAKEELGPKVTLTRVRDVYLIVGAPSWGPGQAKGTAQFVERVVSAFHNNRYARGPAKALPVYLFGDAATYDAYCQKRYQEKCISIYGFFSPADHRLVMNVGLGIGTLSHELSHPMMHADFPDAPTWINEGVASLFEQPIMPKAGEIHGAKNWRYRRLSAALASPKERELVTLPSLFSLSDREFRGDNEGLNYAIARYFCQWMDGQNKLWPFYQKWRDNVVMDPKGEKAFSEVMGKPVSEASPEFVRWVRAL